MCFLGEACEGITWFEFKFRDSSFPGGGLGTGSTLTPRDSRQPGLNGCSGREPLAKGFSGEAADALLPGLCQ